MPMSNPSMPSVPDGLHVDDLTLDEMGLLITARTTAAQASCRVCGRASARVHSQYWRTFKDLPWQDRAVTWRVQVRRFRCNHCPGRVFAEPVPGLGARARRAAATDWPRPRPISAWCSAASPAPGCRGG